jgi:hypothetical protein
VKGLPTGTCIYIYIYIYTHKYIQALCGKEVQVVKGLRTGTYIDIYINKSSNNVHMYQQQTCSSSGMLHRVS